MLTNTNIKELLQKFIRNECDSAETAQVVQYFRENNLTEDFPSVEEVELLLNKMPKPACDNADRIFENIMSSAKQIENTEPRRKSKKAYLAIAASVAVLVAVGLSYKNIFNDSAKINPAINSNEITIQLENGDVQVIKEDGTSILKDSKGNIVANQKGNSIAYDGGSADLLAYNTIKIPNGKRFELQLSDGTSVHLNSGTTLKYPVHFIAGQNRQVFLDGEAFFDVAKDKKHPFIVNADKLNVRVLGTHFNVSDYPEDEQTDVVLVEGSVSLYTVTDNFDVNKNTILKPGFKGSFDKSSNLIATKSVNPDVYTSWMKGNLIFRNMTFKNIARKLERRYNVKIEVQNPSLDNERFNASFKDETIVKVLSYFSEIHSFDYTITDSEIKIK